MPTGARSLELPPPVVLWRAAALDSYVRLIRRRRPRAHLRAREHPDLETFGGQFGRIVVASEIDGDASGRYWLSFVDGTEEGAAMVAANLATVLGRDGWTIDRTEDGEFLISKQLPEGAAT